MQLRTCSCWTGGPSKGSVPTRTIYSRQECRARIAKRTTGTPSCRAPLMTWPKKQIRKTFSGRSATRSWKSSPKNDIPKSPRTETWMTWWKDPRSQMRNTIRSNKRTMSCSNSINNNSNTEKRRRLIYDLFAYINLIINNPSHIHMFPFFKCLEPFLVKPSLLSFLLVDLPIAPYIFRFHYF